MLSYLEKRGGFIEFCSQEILKPEYQDWIELPNGVGIRQVGIAALEILPTGEASDCQVISCGIHGNETAPIEILDHLICDIVTGKLEPKVPMLIILGNPRAMQLQSRFVSINLNRLFNGAYKEYETSEENRYELERAKELEGFVQQFFERYSTLKKYHFDCHTAIKPSFHKTFAIRPYQKSSINKQSLALLQAFGIEAVLQHNKPSTTFSAYSVDQFAAEAYTLELGKVKPFGHNDLSEFAAAINTLEKLSTGIQPEVAQIRVTEYKVVAEIIKNSESFELLVDEDAPNFTAYPQGTLIARDDNYEYRVAHQNEAVVFPNTKVPVGQRVAVMVTPLNVD